MNLFFKQVLAQGIDGVTSATIPYEPPGGIGPTVGPTIPDGLEGPYIKLDSVGDSYQIGETFDVDIIINTRNIQIREYTAVIKYDPNIVRVVSNNPDDTNVKIDFLDTFFEERENIVSSQTGMITLSAVSTEGTATITDRTVARIKFEAISNSPTKIEIIKQNSLLINANSVDILQSVNQLNITIGGIVVNPSDVPPDVTIIPITPPIEPTTSTIVIPTRTPDTAFFDQMHWSQTMILGTIFIVLGIYILNLKKNARIH
jgi:hypothetical protein